MPLPGASSVHPSKQEGTAGKPFRSCKIPAWCTPLRNVVMNPGVNRMVRNNVECRIHRHGAAWPSVPGQKPRKVLLGGTNSTMRPYCFPDSDPASRTLVLPSACRNATIFGTFLEYAEGRIEDTYPNALQAHISERDWRQILVDINACLSAAVPFERYRESYINDITTTLRAAMVVAPNVFWIFHIHYFLCIAKGGETHIEKRLHHLEVHYSNLDSFNVDEGYDGPDQGAPSHAPETPPATAQRSPRKSNASPSPVSAGGATDGGPLSAAPDMAPQARVLPKLDHPGLASADAPLKTKLSYTALPDVGSGGTAAAAAAAAVATQADEAAADAAGTAAFVEASAGVAAAVASEAAGQVATDTLQALIKVESDADAAAVASEASEAAAAAEATAEARGSEELAAAAAATAAAGPPVSLHRDEDGPTSPSAVDIA